ncbi:MAG: class I SAM-dependent methyltransferase [Candidatus Nanoarchaeia archaeon]|nr:class I SAM-dependent methyltransferase [Candidatus Nanoarchaeia archaeon]
MTDILGQKASDYYSKETSKLYELSGAFRRIQESMTADALSLSDFETHSFILDLGCGTGFSLNVLKNNGFNTIGIDISFEMLEYASKKKFKVILADMAFLPFKDEAFDNLISISAIQWAKPSEYEKILQEIKRVIKKEAVIQFYPKEKNEFDYFLKLSKKIFSINQVFILGSGVKEKKYIKLKK